MRGILAVRISSRHSDDATTEGLAKRSLQLWERRHCLVKLSPIARRNKQRWNEGLEEIEAVKVFGAGIEISNVDSRAAEEIVEDEFRRRFTTCPADSFLRALIKTRLGQFRLQPHM